MSKIEYFYSAHSAFAYLGSERFMAVAQAADRAIMHKPIDLTRAIAGAGSSPTRERTAAFRAYFFGREIDRWAEYRNAPVMGGIPTYHSNDPSIANRMIIAGQLAGTNVDQLAHVFLEAHWRDDADLADTDALVSLAVGAGYDGAALLAQVDEAEVGAILEANTHEAVERSVFGSPTYFVDGDMFYGQDRLELIERALATPFAGEWPPG